MRSFFAVLVFIAASCLVVFSQARADVSCGSCGGRNPVEKLCGQVRKDLKYTAALPEKQTVSEVELCLDLASGGVSCGVTSDTLLLASLNSMKVLGVEEVCMKFDTSVSPRRILSAQSRLY